MKIEFTRAEIEVIILDYIKNEIAPYLKFKLEYWNLPDTIIAETEDAAQ
jgi:hypothetical protein